MKISKKKFNLQSGHEYTVEITMFNVQRAITPKVGNQRYDSFFFFFFFFFCTSPVLCLCEVS